IGYTITVHNNGPGTASGVKLSDTLPSNTGTWSYDNASAGWNGCAISAATPAVLSCGGASGVSLASGASLSVHISSTTSTASCPNVTNIASASSTNDGSPSTAGVVIVVNCPDVTLTKLADASPVKGGDTIGFTITATNAGPGTAHDVVISDTLKSTGGLVWSIDAAKTTAQNCSITASVLTCNQGSLGVGSVKVHVTSPTTAAECGTSVPNTATVVLSNGTGDQASASIDITCPVLGI